MAPENYPGFEKHAISGLFLVNIIYWSQTTTCPYGEIVYKRLEIVSCQSRNDMSFCFNVIWWCKISCGRRYKFSPRKILYQTIRIINGEGSKRLFCGMQACETSQRIVERFGTIMIGCCVDLVWSASDGILSCPFSYQAILPPKK